MPTPEPNPFDGTHPEVRDPKALEGLLSRLDVLSKHYFHTEIHGFDHVPDQSCLIVGTHTGGFVATDMFMFFHGWLRRFGARKPLFGLAHDIHFLNPLTRELFARGGAVKASRDMALKVLARDDAHLAVYPTGARELFRPFKDRNKVDFHGHKGFVRLALEAQVPILPMVTTGADTFICLNEGERTAKLLGLDKAFKMPVFPMMLSLPLGLTPGPVPHLPLPAQIRISMGHPIEMPYGPEAMHDAAKVDEIYHHVQATMQTMRDRLRALRQVRESLPMAGLRRLQELQELFGWGSSTMDRVSSTPLRAADRARGTGEGAFVAQGTGPRLWAEGVSTHLAAASEREVFAEGVSTHLAAASERAVQAEGVSTHPAAARSAA